MAEKKAFVKKAAEALIDIEGYFSEDFETDEDQSDDDAESETGINFTKKVKLKLCFLLPIIILFFREMDNEKMAHFFLIWKPTKVIMMDRKQLLIS